MARRIVEDRDDLKHACRKLKEQLSVQEERTGDWHRAYDELRAEAKLDAAEQALTFDQLSETNRQRCEAAFHRVEEWAPWEWSNAMAGECGEACNLTKKMNRIWPANQFQQSWNEPEDQRMAKLEEQLADEIADVVIYADLLATRIGRKLGDCVRDKFNKKSAEIGSNVLLRGFVPPAPQEPR